jgi:hypothetical protein
MKEIIQRIIDGELTRDNDETGADGFWDYAWEQVKHLETDDAMGNGVDTDNLQEIIYNLLWEMAEITII